MDDDDDDLYGDLAASAAEAEIESLKGHLTEKSKEVESLRAEVSQLKQQVMVLVEDKTTLERNIVAVYNTAMREIKRKDNEMASLRQEVASLRSLSGGGPSMS